MAPLKALTISLPGVLIPQFSMPLKHGPIEGRDADYRNGVVDLFSMPLKHGPIEGIFARLGNVAGSQVFHAPKAWPH